MTTPSLQTLPPSAHPSFPAADNNADLHDKCRTLLLDTRGNPDKKKRLQQLEGEDAQDMVDFLCKIAHERGILNDGRFALSRLRDLARKNRVSPQYYHLTGIESDSEPFHGGGFADVYKGKYQSQHLGLKVIRLFEAHDKAKILKVFVKELALWAHLSHTNILPFYGVYLFGARERICLVSPWMKNGSLHDHLQRVPETPRPPLISDIVEGLYYLHSQKVVHGDLKSANVLVSDVGRALIGDFGFSYIAVASGMTSSTGMNRGTGRWAAPELLEDEAQQTRESDMWSLGCLCYEAVTRKYPFHEYAQAARIPLLLKEGGHTPTIPEASDIESEYDRADDRMWEIIKQCWNYDPSSRATCDQFRRALAKLNIVDNRPKQTTEARDGLAFAQAMGAASDLQVNYSRVHDILIKIHQT